MRIGIKNFFSINLLSPEGRKFRSRNELRQYLEKHNLDYNAADFDFSIWGRGNRPPSKNNSNSASSSPSSSASSTVVSTMSTTTMSTTAPTLTPSSCGSPIPPGDLRGSQGPSTQQGLSPNTGGTGSDGMLIRVHPMFEFQRGQSN